MSDTAATWLGRQTITETRGFTPEGQASGEQPTNASSFVQALGDRAGSGDAHQGAATIVSRAALVARPPGSWTPGKVADRIRTFSEDAGTVSSGEAKPGMPGRGLFGR